MKLYKYPTIEAAFSMCCFLKVGPSLPYSCNETNILGVGIGVKSEVSYFLNDSLKKLSIEEVKIRG